MSSAILNLNIGVLGHVDSGKTSLVKVLSTIAGTAAFDKNPQSQQRGITIDLGFSSFLVDIPKQLEYETQCKKLQFTLVDCPGHASLIRTIIGGAQIIDMMILVVDITKGMQTQTAECLVIGEVTCKKMIVVLNKTDLLPPSQRSYLIEKMTKKMKLTLKNTVFDGSPIVSIAAKPNGSDSVHVKPEGLEELIYILKDHAFVPERDYLKPFLFAADHCFSMRGQGTVLTGTMLQGAVTLGDVVEIPALQMLRRVKCLQMFRRPVDSACQGDRVGLCVTQFDPKLLERGIVCAPHYVTSAYAGIISLEKIKYFKGAVPSKSRFHVSMGHETLMAKITVFGLMERDYPDAAGNALFNYIDLNLCYKYLEELVSPQTKEECKDTEGPVRQYAILEFEKQVSIYPGCLVIGSKLDVDYHTNACRLAFSGRLLEALSDKNYANITLPKLNIYKDKSKVGIVERTCNSHEVVVKKLFKKETNLQVFTGLRVTLSTGEKGVIEGAFGQSGKVKIRIPDGLSESTISQITGSAKKRGKQTISQNSAESEPVSVLLQFRRLLYDSSKTMVQM